MVNNGSNVFIHVLKFKCFHFRRVPGFPQNISYFLLDSALCHAQKEMAGTLQAVAIGSYQGDGWYTSGIHFLCEP